MVRFNESVEDFLTWADALLRVHEEGRGREEQEDDATDEGDGPNRDLLRDHAASEDGQ